MAPKLPLPRKVKAVAQRRATQAEVAGERAVLCRGRGHLAPRSDNEATGQDIGGAMRGISAGAWRIWLAAWLRAVADEEDGRRGQKEIAADFRMRAEMIEQTKPDWPKGRDSSSATAMLGSGSV